MNVGFRFLVGICRFLVKTAWPNHWPICLFSSEMKKYQPISCDFHSELELFALRQQPIEITYTAADGQQATICEAIKDLYTRNGEEFLLLPNGHEIRLDQLVSVGGKVLSSFC